MTRSISLKRQKSFLQRQAGKLPARKRHRTVRYGFRRPPFARQCLGQIPGGGAAYGYSSPATPAATVSSHCHYRRKGYRHPLCTISIEKPKVGDFTEFLFENKPMRLYRMPSSSRAYPLALEKKPPHIALCIRTYKCCKQLSV